MNLDLKSQQEDAVWGKQKQIWKDTQNAWNFTSGVVKWLVSELFKLKFKLQLTKVALNTQKTVEIEHKLFNASSHWFAECGWC